MTLDFEKKPFQKISDVIIPDAFFNRLRTGVDALDSIFGMGLLPGSTLTLKALPGVGKSIFALTLGELLTHKNYRVAYSTGEEDVCQVAYNCQRLNIKDLRVGTITDVDLLLEELKELDFMVIDSFQTLTTDKKLNSVGKIHYFIDNLVKQAKVNSCTLLFIVQETADGGIRGGMTLPYAVDGNFSILKIKDNPELRIIDMQKHRFGPTMKHEAKLTSEGYEFIGEYNEEKDMKEKKESVKVLRKEQVMAINDPPLITVNRVVETLGVKPATAKLILVDLENEMKLIKYGRGDSAIWKLNL